MTLLTVVYALLFYFAAIVLVVFTGLKIKQFATVPSPLVIPTTPAPITKTGVVFRVAREVALFESLFKSNRWIWIFAVLFHAGMAIALVRHLRYFVEPVWGWLALMQPLGIYGGMAMVVGLLGLWARRLLVDRVRYISNPSDHLMLALLVGIGASGLGMKFVAHTDIVQLKAFALGLVRFDWQPLPSDPALLIHLGLVAVLMIVFPFSKLLHAPGVFFSPTRTMVDNPRERRHVAAWAAPMDATRER
ncbi:respiratory nitrate reductase subunit gamma [Magnetospira sp. QH-2]|uniref:respiratory nitrate reductase subunit gamma n=1 Tax=Magnetospira sp. (strain QH-2) TaxID=1288970 RepID=UPI0003E80F54|nr:respiratory nitrate reductase subunit gamma [Magnetospira sp. QH-2]CCQ74008.1 Hdr-like menaquinol oxidoreductase subunit DsrM/HmeC [Magnetospira sp. QH-2]